MAEVKKAAEALVPKFVLERALNFDQGGRRASLLGTIDGQPALLILERAPFPADTSYLASVPCTLRRLRNLGANDIYAWYVAASGGATEGGGDGKEDDFTADLKINLIYPCTEQHVAKYSRQGVRFVTETPETYRTAVRPYMERKRSGGRLNWVYNILEGKSEAEDVIYRTPYGLEGGLEGFLFLPDLNWDRTTIEAMHLLAIVERRDIWSLRDLRRRHVPWLRHMRAKILAAAVETYASKGVEEDQLKLYVHYQPTYYHFHIHVVHVALEAGATQATGKAIGLESILSQLETMAGDDDDVGMDSVTLCYTVGEASELWTEVFEPLKRAAAGNVATN